MTMKLGWKSRRLTKDLKDQIIEKVSKNLFGKRTQVIKNRLNAIGKEMHADTIGRVDLALMKQLPEEFFSRNTSFWIRIGEGRSIQVHLIKALPLPAYCSSYGRNINEYAETNELAKKYRAWEKDREQLNDDRRKTLAEVRGMLNSANTEKQLLVLWPEALQYLPVPPKVTKNLPVPECKEMNDLLAKMYKINKETA